ncbi:hypothetical protein ACM26V_09500 [Salipaludibacillus sp. HK11]|uniref:hypothetical protein n=1 Tax=Salipaludibacillus sp. HK11 TaxID=3394320 RepID=UPI0039FDB2C9
MKTFRVGTVSMGSALLLLGVFLLISTFTGMDLYPVLMSWWPIILIILGIEILLFLFFRGKQELSLKYDVFSIVFIGFLGTVAVVFAIISSMGITEKVSASLFSEEVSTDFPAFDQVVDSEIERIVFETTQGDVSIEGMNNQELTIFGTFNERILPEASSRVSETDDYMSVNQRGDTLFVTFKDLPIQDHWNNYYSMKSFQILVPNDVAVEVRSRGTNLSLRPREVLSNWTVDGGDSVSLYAPKNSDLLIEAIGVNQLSSDNNSEWDLTTDEEESSDERQSGKMILGDETNHFRLTDAYNVAVYIE